MSKQWPSIEAIARAQTWIASDLQTFDRVVTVSCEKCGGLRQVRLVVTGDKLRLIHMNEIDMKLYVEDLS